MSVIKSRISSETSNKTDKNDNAEQPTASVKTEERVTRATSQHWGGGPSGSNKSLFSSHTVVRKSSRLSLAEANPKSSSG